MSLGFGAGFGAGLLVFLLESCGGEPRWGESAFLRFPRFLGFARFSWAFPWFSFGFPLVFLGFPWFSWVFLGFPWFSFGVGVGVGGYLG